jgi:hypothetical protein
VLRDDVALELPVLAQPAATLVQSLAAIARNRLGVRGAFGVQRLLGFAQHLAAITRGAQPFGQLVTALLAEQRILGRVNPSGLLEDLPGDLLIVAGGVMRRRRGDLGAVNRDHADLDQAAARTQRQHLAEQAGDRGLVANAEARNGRVIGRLVGRDDAEGDVVAAAPLDAAR